MIDHSLLTSDNIYDAETGQFISAQHMRVAEIIADYNPDLRVVWIPTAERTASSPKPFGVAHFPKDKEPYVIFFMTEEEMTNGTAVLEKLILADQGRGAGANVFSRLNAAADAAKLMKEKEQADAMAERHEMAKSMFRSTNSRYQLGKGRTIDLSA